MGDQKFDQDNHSLILRKSPQDPFRYNVCASLSKGCSNLEFMSRLRTGYVVVVVVVSVKFLLLLFKRLAVD